MTDQPGACSSKSSTERVVVPVFGRNQAGLKTRLYETLSLTVNLEPLRTRNLTLEVKFRGSQVTYSGPRPVAGPEAR